MIHWINLQELPPHFRNRNLPIRTYSYNIDLKQYFIFKKKKNCNYYRPEKQIKMLESTLHEIVEESIIAQNKEEFRLALDKAKEAINKERSLLRQKEQSGMSETNNDLAFMVGSIFFSNCTWKRWMIIVVISHFRSCLTWLTNTPVADYFRKRCPPISSWSRTDPTLILVD